MKTITKLATTAIFALGAITSGFAQANQDNLGAKCGCPPVHSRTIVDLTTYAGGVTTNGFNEIIGTSTTGGVGTLGAPTSTVVTGGTHTVTPSGNESNNVGVNIHLPCTNLYTINNKVYVPANFTLTIDPGTVLAGVHSSNPANCAALIIERGAKINAAGTGECNIVFTTDQEAVSGNYLDGTYSISNVAKWGGLSLMGLATNNLIAANNTAVSGSSYPNGAVPLCNGLDGEGYAEGFALTGNAGNTFGTNPNDPQGFTTPNDADNSGVLTYVSIRHGGELIGTTLSALGNEINALTLNSVGSGTTLEHIELIASGDDEIELFGGAAQLKYISGYFSDDDKIDFDDGFHGKGQFLFSIAADSLNSVAHNSSDNGFEGDADDQFGSTKTAFPFQSNPTFYNATFISNGRTTLVLDNTGHAGIEAKEMTAGTFKNCIFANFRAGVHLSEVRSNSGLKGDAYDQWTNGSDAAYQNQWTGVSGPTGSTYPTAKSLIIQDNIVIVPSTTTTTPVGNLGLMHFGFARGSLAVADSTFGNGKYEKLWTVVSDGTGNNANNVTQWKLANSPQTAYQASPTTIAPKVGIPTSADSTQFLVTDRNQIVTSVPGINYNWSWSSSSYTGFTNAFSPIPLPSATNVLNSPSSPTADGFFSVVNYKGAFDPSGEQNASWLSNYGLITVQSMGESNPTDINRDGVTDVNDFLQLLGKYGQKDN